MSLQVQQYVPGEVLAACMTSGFWGSGDWCGLWGSGILGTGMASVFLDTGVASRVPGTWVF